MATSGTTNAVDAGKAALILASVSGKEMLASIVASKESNIQGVSSASETTTPLEFAKGGNATNVSGSTDAKAAAVSGGIALRSLVKSGKLAAGGTSDAQGGEKEVQKVGITAVNKLLLAVEGIIQKTVKKVLEKAKTKIDEARKPKAVGNE